jgi:general stress protein CsbA
MMSANDDFFVTPAELGWWLLAVFVVSLVVGQLVICVRGWKRRRKE